MNRRWAARLACLLTLGALGCARPGPSRSPSPESLAAHLSGMIWPLPIDRDQDVRSAFGRRGRRHHDGLDIRGRGGEPIHAAREGRVAFSGWRNGYGNTVMLEHGGGVTTLYAHASALLVAAGDSVTRGQPVARVGATGNAQGNHLHFEVAWAGVPFDPTLLLPALAPR